MLAGISWLWLILLTTSCSSQVNRQQPPPTQTFDLSGVIQAHDDHSGDISVGAYPVTLSWSGFAANVRYLVLCSDNNVNFKQIDLLTDPGVLLDNPQNNSRSYKLNLKYGRRFYFMYDNSQPVSIFPGVENLSLINVGIVQWVDNVHYVFRVILPEYAKPGQTQKGALADTTPLPAAVPDTAKYFKTLDQLKAEYSNYFLNNQVRIADYDNYKTTGYISLPCYEIFHANRKFFLTLVKMNAIGKNDQGQNSSTVVMAPATLQNGDKRLYERYRHKIQYPAKSTNKEPKSKENVNDQKKEVKPIPNQWNSYKSN